jgi:hypothetical protein
MRVDTDIPHLGVYGLRQPGGYGQHPMVTDHTTPECTPGDPKTAGHRTHPGWVHIPLPGRFKPKHHSGYRRQLPVIQTLRTGGYRPDPPECTKFNYRWVQVPTPGGQRSPPPTGVYRPPPARVCKGPSRPVGYKPRPYGGTDPHRPVCTGIPPVGTGTLAPGGYSPLSQWVNVPPPVGYMSPPPRGYRPPHSLCGGPRSVGTGTSRSVGTGPLRP